jgi:hypothetical protein
MQMDWSDLVLRLIRAAGALASALAGIAALLTDGAFVKRDPPLDGRWKDFPFAKYRVTRWGGTLLAVILIAPTVQFIGDWMKDASDTKSQQQTANQIRQDIDGTVKNSTELARQSILGTVGTVIDEQKSLGAQTSNIARGANDILTDINRNLYPFKDVTWAYEVRINLNHPKMQSFRDFIRQKSKEIFDRNQNLGNGLKPGDSILGGSDYKSVAPYQSYGQRKRLLVGIDSPFLRESDPAFGAILGYEVYVDLFRNSPTLSMLSKHRFRSPDYAVTLLPPYSSDVYEMTKAADRFPLDSYRSFQLIYVPGDDNDPNSDQCFVDYYWHALEKFDILTERSETTIAGLPDLDSTLFVVRLETVSEYWGSEAPYSIEFLRMHVGAQELTFSRSDLGSPSSRNGYLTYRKRMPKDFNSVLRLFETVRSDEDKKPTSTTRLVVK